MLIRNLCQNILVSVYYTELFLHVRCLHQCISLVTLPQSCFDRGYLQQDFVILNAKPFIGSSAMRCLRGIQRGGLPRTKNQKKIKAEMRKRTKDIKVPLINDI